MKNRSSLAPEPLALPALTEKQREVMALVADNRTSKEIASRLGISESAVNQRIEQIRTRLGGLPRGEIARLYRQEFAREQTISSTFPPTWKKIQVQSSDMSGQTDGAEGPSGFGAAQMHPHEAGIGSQPSRPLLPAELAWLSREEPRYSLARTTMIIALLLAGMAAAAAITEWMGLTSAH